MALSEQQVRRYARHILLPDVGGRGQERLLAASVTVEVGPGRDAEVAALAYLAAAGIGRLRLSGDPDGAVTDAEVAGGILYGTADVGRPRVDAVRDRLAGLNPDVAVEVAAGVRDPATRYLDRYLDRSPDCIDAVRDPATRYPSSAPDPYAVAHALEAGCAAAVRALASITRAEP